MVSFGLPEKHLEINRFVNFSCILNIILNGIVPIFNAYGYCKCTCRQWTWLGCLVWCGMTFVDFFLQWKEIYSWLPKRFTLKQPKLIFSTCEHGTSLSTFYNRIEGYEPTFLAIKTSRQEVSLVLYEIHCGQRLLTQICYNRFLVLWKSFDVAK